jgi:hypothetical protein
LIVLESKQLVILTPPHTASKHLHEALCCPPHNGLWVVGHNADGNVDHHVAIPSEPWRHFQVVCVVRNPLERLRGLWVHHLVYARRQGFPPLLWPQYVAAVVTERWGVLPSFLDHFTIARWLHKTAVQDVIRFESLADELLRVVGSPVELAPGWTDDGEHPLLEELYAETNPGVRFHAAAWSLPDRVRWDYGLPWKD